MQDYYNMDQTTLSIALDYLPEENHPARYINTLVESLKLDYSYQFGRPREYDLAAMLKLVLLAYTYGIFSSRQIEKFARENKPAGWLIADQVPSYRTICRFRISDDLASLTKQSLNNLTLFLRDAGVIDDVTFIDGTKILADANKYSFVWRKNTVRFDKMNRDQLVTILGELHEAKLIGEVPTGSDLNLGMLDAVIGTVEDRLVTLDEEVQATKKISPNPAKKQRRILKAQRRKLTQRRDKMIDHQNQQVTFGQRNSYSKTDHDATFMRVKEDPMQNGQLKPAYNLQIATSNQFITGFDLFQNPTDTRTFPLFLASLESQKVLGKVIVADAGYGSESNYRYCEDELDKHVVLVPYGTMLKENSRKWQSDDRKVMNWDYYEKDDYFIDPKGVRFNFKAYRKSTDKYGFTRGFKEYEAEKYNENHEVIPLALTPKKRLRRIKVNEAWEYFKAKERTQLSKPENKAIYGRRKIDVEPIFGKMKAYLHFNRYSVRGLAKVKKETGILVLALNILKLVSTRRRRLENQEHGNKARNQSSVSCLIFVLQRLVMSQPLFCTIRDAWSQAS